MKKHLLGLLFLVPFILSTSTNLIESVNENENITIHPKGTGGIRHTNDSDEYINFKIPASTTSHSYTWPDSQGILDTFLRNDGNGILSWVVLSVTLQGAYEGGNVISTDNSNGDVIISGTEALQITATGGIDMTDKEITTTTTNGDIVFRTNGTGSIIGGASATSTGDHGISLGVSADVSALGGIAIGLSSNTDGIGGVSLGYFADAATNYTTAIGRFADVDSASTYGVSIGGSTSASTSANCISAFAGIAIGRDALSNGAFAIGIGGSAEATAAQAMAFGKVAKSDTAYQTVFSGVSAVESTDTKNNILMIDGGTGDLHVGRYINQFDHAFNDSNVTFGTDTFTITDHGFSANDKVNLSGPDIPAPLAEGTTYYIIYTDSANFKLSTTAGGGGLVDLTDDGGAGSNWIYEVDDMNNGLRLHKVVANKQSEFTELKTLTGGTFSIVPPDLGGNFVYGVDASAGIYGIAMGWQASAIGTAGVAIGSGATTIGSAGTSVGRDTESALNGTALGFSAEAGQSGVAVGDNADSTTSASAIAIGHDAAASSYRSIAIGEAALGSSAGGMALGHGADAASSYGNAYGRMAKSHGSFDHAFSGAHDATITTASTDFNIARIEGYTGNFSIGKYIDQYDHSFDDGDVTNGTDTFTITDHGFIEDDEVNFSGPNIPSPLVEGVTYYVVYTDTANFKVSATAIGAAINLTTDGGAGPNYIYAVGSMNNGLRLHGITANEQSHYIGHKAQHDITSDTTYVWPNDGSADEVLTTDGSGNLGWQNISHTYTENKLDGDCTTDADSDFADLTFSGLTVGAEYELHGQFFIAVNVGDVDDALAEVLAKHNSVTIGRVRLNSTDSQETDGIYSMHKRFTAAATTVTFEGVSLSATSYLQGDGTNAETFATLSLVH